MDREQRVAAHLRFKDDNGAMFPDWRTETLGDIAQFSKGKGISKADISEDGDLECIRYGELYTDYNETISDVISRTDLPAEKLTLSRANDVIIPASGESQLDIATASCVLKDGVALGGDLNIIRTNENGVFLSYYLNSAKKREIAALSQGNSVVHLYSGQLKTLTVQLPSIEEQQKIASFLSSVDEKIRNLSQQIESLKQFKYGIMQGLFSQEEHDHIIGGGNLTRRLSLTDATGSGFPQWRTKRLGELTIKVSERNKKKFDVPIYSVTNDRGFVLQSEQFDREVASEDLTSYKIIHGGEFAYNPARINVGSIARFCKEIGIISSLYVCFKTNSQVDDDYLWQILQLKRTKFQISNLGEGGVRVYLWYPLFALIKIPIPSMTEQKRLAEALHTFDKKIEIVSAQYETTLLFKKAMLQQLFN